MIESVEWRQRYINGESRAIWLEMAKVGPAVKEAPYREAAKMVCREFADRCRANIASIVKRLQTLEYEFWDGNENFVKLTPSEAEAPWTCSFIWKASGSAFPLASHREIAKTATLPLTIESWIAVVGDSVTLLGKHPRLSPQYCGFPHPEVFPDPMDVFFCFDPDYSAEDRSRLLAVSLIDSVFKSTIVDAVTSGYETEEKLTIRLPSYAVDAAIENWREPVTFVEYMRRVFEWGGFPGWELYPDQRPEAELAFLREGLWEVQGVEQRPLPRIP